MNTIPPTINVDTSKLCFEYLENYKIQDNIYTTGLFDTGITIFRQQIRALNVFYALNVCERVNRNSNIFVVGGGVAGLTFTAACMEAGFKVHLIEQESSFLHLQDGCDIRQVHPHIYDWPEKGSLFPYAKLPVLSWKADSASNVAKQIVKSFLDLKKSNTRCVFRTNVSKSSLSIIKNKNESLFTVRGSGKLNGKGQLLPFSFQADLIVYCTGFGIETGAKSKTPSYWRNEDYSQTVVNEYNKFIVSGSGDGALMDLFRLKIRNFSYEQFLSAFYSFDEDNTLANILTTIKRDWPDRDVLSRDWLYRKFEVIPRKFLRHFTELFLSLARDSVEVTLVAEKEIFEILNLDSISFINAFVFFLLENYRQKPFFKHIKGSTKECNNDRCHIEEITKSGEIVTVKYNSESGYKFIVRHGTNRLSAFHDTIITSKNLADLKDKQTSFKFNTGKQIWDFPSINRYFPNTSFPKGYCTSETIAFCSNFIAILNKIIQQVCKTESISGEFRLCLLRVLQSSNKLYYQQVSPYYGTKNSEGNVGKIFSLDRGNVGLSILTGKPILLVKEEDDTTNLIDVLNLGNSKSLLKANSFLSVPILAKNPNKTLSTNIILYIDSTSKTIFSNEKLLAIIISSLEGFVDGVHKSLNKLFSMGEVTFNPRPVVTNMTDLENQVPGISMLLEKFYSKEIEEKLCSLASKSELVFKDFYSFDIYHEYRNVID